MPEISNTSIYVPVTEYSSNDFWVGTDSNDLNRAKTFFLGQIADFVAAQLGVGDGQNNRVTEIALGTIAEADLATTINNLDAFTIAADEIIVFTGIFSGGLGTSFIYAFQNGKGSYGTGGTAITTDDLILLNPKQEETKRNSAVIESIYGEDKILSGALFLRENTLIFDSVGFSYMFNGNVFNIADKEITLSDADPTHGRFDRFAVDLLAGDVIVLEGTPSATPEIEEVVFGQQISIGEVYISATATTPEQEPGTAFVFDTITDETDAEPDEWDLINTGTSVVISDTTNPISGSKSVYFPTGSTGITQWRKNEDVPHNDDDFLELSIRLDAPLTPVNYFGVILPTTSIITLSLYHSGSNSARNMDLTYNPRYYNLGNYTFNNESTDPQIIRIPISDFQVAGQPLPTYDSFRITPLNHPDFRIDNVFIRRGIAIQQQLQNLSDFYDDIGATEPIVAQTVFVDTVNGNDTTATIENRERPFATDTAALAALPEDDGSTWTLQYIDVGAITRTMNTAFPARNLELRCLSTGGEFDFTAITGSNISATNLKIYCPNVDLVFNQALESSFGTSGKLEIDAYDITEGAFHATNTGFFRAGASISDSYIKCNDFNLSGAKPIGFNGNLDIANELIFNGDLELLGNNAVNIDVDVNTLNKNTASNITLFGGNGSTGSLKLKKIIGDNTGIIIVQSNYSRKMTYNFEGLDKQSNAELRLGNGLDSKADITIKGTTETNATISLAGLGSVNLKITDFTGRLEGFNPNVADAVDIKATRSTIYTSTVFIDNTNDELDSLLFDKTSVIQDTPGALINNVVNPFVVDIIGTLDTTATSLGSNVTANYLTSSKYPDVDNLLATQSEITTSRDFVLSDAEGMNVINSAGDITLTVRLDSVIDFPIGTVLPLNRKEGSTGTTTIAYEGGVTGEAGGLYTDKDGGSLRKTAANTWEVIGFPPTNFDALQTDVTANNAKVGVTTEEENTINSSTAGEPTGSDQVLNVVSLTQAEYDAGTPVATTFYIITDA